MRHSSNRPRVVTFAVILTALFTMFAGLLMPAVSMADGGGGGVIIPPDEGGDDSTGPGSSLPSDGPDGIIGESQTSGVSLWDIVLAVYTVTI